jgi:hypothetical protein
LHWPRSDQAPQYRLWSTHAALEAAGLTWKLQPINKQTNETKQKRESHMTCYRYISAQNVAS